MRGTQASERLLYSDLRPRSTILEVFWAVKTSLRGFSGMHGSWASEGLL